MSDEERLALAVILRSERFEELIDILLWDYGDFREGSTHEAGFHWIVPRSDEWRSGRRHNSAAPLIPRPAPKPEREGGL